MKVKVRIAPSPTGFLHIGTAQSALYNWLFARKNGGDFCLRIEDTDRERSTKEYETSILDALKWLDLNWNGDVVRQSASRPYMNYLGPLLESHKVVEKNVDGEKSRSIFILKVDSTANPVTFTDIIRGDISVNRKFIGDQIIARRPNDSTDDIIILYNFAAVVDDIAMGITHVIRGEDHISNTPKQILIYEALGKTPPQFAHLPLILAPDRSKLSKRHGATAVVDYKKDYLPEAIINFLGAMSYTFSKEILTKEEMIDEFELSKVHKSGAMFDIKKLNWINSQYVKKLSAEEFKTAVGIPEIPDAAVPLITERLEKLSGVENFSYLWKKPNYNPDMLERSPNVEVSGIISSLYSTAKIIDKVGVEDKGKLRTELDKSAKESFNGDRGAVYWPFRVSATGQEKSPDPVEVSSVLGKPETKERIKEAIQKLENEK